MEKSPKAHQVPSNAITEQGIKALLKKKAKKVGSLSGWATNNGITPQAVSAFMCERQGPGSKIPEALGYKPQVIYIPIEVEDIQNSYRKG